MPCARRTCGHGIQRHHNGPCQRCSTAAAYRGGTPCPSFQYPASDPRSRFNQETDPMPRKPPTPSAPTIQIGLAAVLGDGSTQKPDAFNVSLDKLKGRIEKPDHTRYDLKSDPHNPLPKWAEFVQSIQQRGLDTPISVRPTRIGEGYDLVDGRHRALALQQLRYTEAPVLLRKDYDDGDAAMAEIVTNTQRSRGGNPYREAQALHRAMQAKGWTVEQAASHAGRSTTWVGERLRILQITDDGGPAGEALALRIGHDIGSSALQPIYNLLALPKDVPDRAAMIQAGLEAAGKTTRTDAWGLEDAIMRGLEKKGATVVNQEFARHEVREDPAFKKAVAKLPSLAMQRSNALVVFDKQSVQEARTAAVARLTVRDAKKRKPDGEKVDVKGMEARRLEQLQVELVTRAVKARVSYGRDWEKLLVLRWLRNLGLIGSRKADKALMKELTGIDKWDGRGPSLVKPVEASWGKAEAGRIMHVALYLETNRRNSWSESGVPDPLASEILGKTAAALKAQAKRDVVAKLNADKQATKAAPKALTAGQRKAAEAQGAASVRKRLAAKAAPPAPAGDGGEEDLPDIEDPE